MAQHLLHRQEIGPVVEQKVRLLHLMAPIYRKFPARLRAG